MNWKNNILFIISVSILIGGTLLASDVRAVVDRNTLALNDVFNFQVVVENGDDNPVVDISPILKDFTVVSGPSQHTSMNWVNGKMSSTRKVSWSLVANKTGKLNIPSLNVKVGNKTVKTDPIMMNVVESAANNSSEDLFIQVEVDRDEVYLGQQVTVTYKLYTRVNMSIQDLQLPEFRGFWSEELYLPKQIDFRDATLNGVSYKVANLYKVAIFPTALGHVSLPPLTLKTQVETKRASKARRSVFDDPFFNSFDPFGRQLVPKVLRSEDVSIHIIDFPKPIPDRFDNAVGNFKIYARLDSSELKMNEATTLRITLDGTGNLNLITIPEPIFPDGLEVFSPTVKTEKDPFRDQITGTIDVEYIIIPRKTGKMIIPGIAMTVFDPKSKEWKELKTKAQELSVKPGLENSFAAQGHTREEIQLLSSDIRYIHTSVPDWNYANYTMKKIAIGVFYVLSCLVLIFPALSTKVQVSRSNSFLERRSSSASKKAIKALKNNNEDPFSVSSKAIYQFLRDRFYLRSDKLDPLQVNLELKNKVPEEDLIQLVEFLKKCDAGRYAPGGEEALENAIETAGSLIKRINQYG